MRLVLLLLSGLVFSGYVWAQDDNEQEGPVLEYIEMAPKFTVNLDKPRKYLLINVQLMVEGKDNAEKVKKHMPALRHELIMLYSDLKVNDLETMEQREDLRQKSIDMVKKTLEKYANIDGFRDLFFSEFLVN